MSKLNILMSVVVGLVAGQIFAEGAGPLTVENSVKVGYSDNYYYRPDSTKEEKTFVQDVLDLAFQAALSDRTDLTVKSQLNLLSDSDGVDLYPNLYAMLNHSFSERLLMRLSEYYRSGSQNGDNSSKPGVVSGRRYDFFENRVETSADYVLTEKDRLQASLNHEAYRYDRAINDLDTTKVNGGLTWSHELIAKRTFASLNVRQGRVSYDHRADDTASRDYLGDDALYDQTELTAGLTHTFNPDWSGNVEGGVTRTQNKNSDYKPSPFVTTVQGNNEMTVDPVVRAGLAYSPSPQTKLAADVSVSRTDASTDTDYTSENDRALTLSAEQGITGKLTAKASASLTNSKLNKEDSRDANAQDKTQDRTKFALGLNYKLNRINFLDLDLEHNQVDRDSGTDWKENRVTIGWRVVLN